jgi:hypothetical protein
MVMRSSLFMMAMALGGSCTARTSEPRAEHDAARDKESGTVAEAPGPDAGVAAKASLTSAPAKPEKEDVGAYLKAHLPAGGSVEGERLFHTAKAGDTIPSVALAYLELTEIYTKDELANAIGKKNPSGLVAGKKIEIPQPLTRAPRDPREEKLGWPEDKALRGIFVTGPWAQMKWVDTLDKLAARGLNAVVLDSKDYEGPVNYATKAKIAVEIGAAAKAPIPNLARMIRFAHWRGIRVVLRIPCFHDPIADKKAKDARLSIRHATADVPLHMNWIDPANKEAQDYAIELAQEGVDAGADEIQLDYVRFPVHVGQKTARLPDPDKRSGIIRDFVKRVRAVTKPAGVMLSLDLFGVAATGEKGDIDRLGQEIGVVGPEADAISPMVYPSHYNKGYMGFSEPGDHPEIVGIGTKAAAKQLAAVGSTTVVRSWVQAFPWKTSIYGTKYVVDQAKSAEAGGGYGWLMWSPSCEYSPVWNGWPVTKAKPGEAVATTRP